MGSKSGGSSQSYNYFGTVSGLVCRGPVDQLLAVIVDGKAIWEGSHSRPSTYVAPDNAHPLNSRYTDLSALIDAKWFAKAGNVRDGWFRVYWGDAAAAVPVGQEGAPDYKGWCYFWAVHFLFGRERTSAPNIELVVARKPVVDTALVLATDNTMEDGQANPVACLAEILTSDHGAGLAVDRFDGASWRAAAAAVRTDPALTYCSPFLGAVTDLRSACAGLLAMFDGALAWNAEGKLAVRLLEPGVNPGGLLTLDAPLLVEPAALDVGAWGGVPTDVVVRFVDRERKYKAADHRTPNLVASRMQGGEVKTLALDRPHITRANQAARWASEQVRRSMMPAASVDLVVRPERATGLSPGSKVLVDVDPEPGGDGLAQLGVVEERRDPFLGPVKLKVVCDPLATATPYSPEYEPADPEESAVDPLVHALIVPVPTALSASIGVLILTTRSQANLVGYDVSFLWDADGDTSIADETAAGLGRGVGFACRLDLTSAMAEDAATGTFHLTDESSGSDAYLSDLMPDGQIEAAAAALVIVLANVDANGRVTVTSGVPELEFLSVVSRTPAGPSDTDTYTVIRAQLGLPARAWTTGCQAWICPRGNLAAWGHPDMVGLLRSGGVGTIRLAAATADGVADTLLERTWTFPASYDLAPRVTWINPAGSLGVTDVGGVFSISFTVLDWEGDLTAFRVHAELAGGNRVEIEPWMPVGPTKEESWTRAHTFPVGAHRVVVTARDKRGIETTSDRTILRASPGSIPPPSFNPAGADNLPLQGISVTITGVSPATKLEHSLVPVGVGSPAGAGTAVAALTAPVGFFPPKRLWARAGDDGGNWSAWVSADYTFATSGSGGGGSGGGGGGRGGPPILQV